MNKIENFQSNRASINLQNYQSIHYIIKMDKILQKRKKVIINEKVTSAKDQWQEITFIKKSSFFIKT